MIVVAMNVVVMTAMNMPVAHTMQMIKDLVKIDDDDDYSYDDAGDDGDSYNDNDNDDASDD